MKKGVLINSEISYAISMMGHGDGLVIADSGLPVPNDVVRIDVSISKGIPSFLDVLSAVLSELKVEEVIIASELKDKSPDMYRKLHEKLSEYQNKEKSMIKVKEVCHENFKVETQKSKAIIRTGEYTPYANIILKSGVVF